MNLFKLSQNADLFSDALPHDSQEVRNRFTRDSQENQFFARKSHKIKEPPCLCSKSLLLSDDVKNFTMKTVILSSDCHLIQLSQEYNILEETSNIRLTTRAGNLTPEREF